MVYHDRAELAKDGSIIQKTAYKVSHYYYCHSPMSKPVVGNKNFTFTNDDSDGDGIEAPMPPRKPGAYKPTRRAALVSHTSSSMYEKKEIKVVPKSEESTAKIREITNSNFLFATLDASQKQTIIGLLSLFILENRLLYLLYFVYLIIMIDAMFPMQKKKGDIIIKQGDQGDNFYVLDSGEVDVLITPPKDPKSTEQPKAAKVGHMGPGSGFGELALLHNCPRAATILATTDCSLWAIDQVTYRQVMMQSTLQKRNKYLDFISRVPFFDKLNRYQRSSVCDALSEAQCAAGENIVVQGERGDKFFIIEDGVCDVLIQSSSSASPVCVGHMKSPQFFGEVALLHADALRTATVKAQTAVKLLVLDKQAFTRLLGPISGELEANILSYTNKSK